ncbi:phage late control D family protein [Mitsuaria sp. GD03876]|uniref:phage late control D family protein n=1 Tax=Mitsuaria sp. GD03876 TaxID=2975399 RepID=UPI00244CE1A0|nr:phage late control D family protein [Mitsuaria sp. GD03876]MDH0866466.1 phage late control D family protein [Mitsuaria sp. GD03876]
MTRSSYPAPDYRLVVDGTDITVKINPRLISLSLTECRGGEADQLDLVLDDADGRLAIPPKKATIELHLGWAGQALVDKGTFVVDEVEHSGAPDQLQIRARSADMAQTIKVRVERSWHQHQLGTIVGSIAAKHGLTPRIDKRLASTVVDHIDQTNESDLNFISRLAKRFDAVSSVKKGTLIFVPINGTRDSQGLALSPQTISRDAGDGHRFHSAEREVYSGVRAYWHDTKRAKRRGVIVGLSGNAKRLRDTYANQADALAGAKAEWQRIQRGAATLELTLARGRPELGPQTPVTVVGFKPAIDAVSWLTVKSTHSLGDGGLVTRIELETSTSVDGSHKVEDSDAPTA